MTITKERMDILTGILNADPERANNLLALGVDDAVAEINALGHNFTAAELSAYGEGLKKASELSEDDLEAVAGGVSGDLNENSTVPVITLPMQMPLPQVWVPSPIWPPR